MEATPESSVSAFFENIEHATTTRSLFVPAGTRKKTHEARNRSGSVTISGFDAEHDSCCTR